MRVFYVYLFSVSCWLMFAQPTTAGENHQEHRLEFNSLSPALRERIDRLSMTVPETKKSAKRIEVYGDVVAWLTSQSPLTAQEEAERATVAHRETLRTSKIVPTPLIAEKVFERLVSELPQRMKPDSFSFSLTVVEDPRKEAFTVGGGFVYISKDYIEALLAADDRREDLLAFVLAREIGHICREDCRLGYRFLRMEEELGSEIDSRRVKRVLETTVAISGKLVAFAYSGKQEIRADLFALHLCRNARFKQQSGLGVLRNSIINSDPTILQDDSERKTPTKEILTLLRRLKHLHRELSGDQQSDNYGLFAFRSDEKTLLKLEDQSLEPNIRCVVFIHGMESDLKTHDAMMRSLSSLVDEKQFRILGFRYPNDGSLARSGKFLKREINRVFQSTGNIDFVCHSAGGLVFRYYAEVENGDFRKAIFEGTPHAGSDLAKLRPILEARQFLGDLKLGYSESLEQALLDGTGQMTYDLKPESLFLRYLNRSKRQTNRYYIIRGRVMKPVKAALLRTGMTAARKAVQRKIDASGKSERSRRQMSRWTNLLQLPEEVTRGDLAVTLRSAELEGAALVKTFPVSHGKLPRHTKVMETVTEILMQIELETKSLPTR